jgi:ABC-type multidrug transport system permease subunit
MWRIEDGRFPVSATCVTISNPDSLSSSKAGVNFEIRSWKSTHPNELDVRKPLVVSISQKEKKKIEEQKLYNLVWNLSAFFRVFCVCFVFSRVFVRFFFFLRFLTLLSIRSRFLVFSHISSCFLAFSFFTFWYVFFCVFSCFLLRLERNSQMPLLDERFVIFG